MSLSWAQAAGCYFCVTAFTAPFREETEGEPLSETSCWVSVAAKSAVLVSIVAECRCTEELHLFSCLRSLALGATVFYAISYGILILKAYCEIWTKKAPSVNAELIFWSLWQEKAPMFLWILDVCIL